AGYEPLGEIRVARVGRGVVHVVEVAADDDRQYRRHPGLVVQGLQVLVRDAGDGGPARESQEQERGGAQGVSALPFVQVTGGDEAVDQTLDGAQRRFEFAGELGQGDPVL